MEARRLRKRNKPSGAGSQPAAVSQTAPISPAKLAANQANAQLSTGPRTEAGREVSSRNNTRHGLAGDFRLLAGEDAGQFQILVDSLIAEHKPKTTTETLLVWDIARHHWLTQRALRLQDEAFLSGSIDENKLKLFMRYQTTHQRAFHKCLNDLLKLQKQRAVEERGFESHGYAAMKTLKQIDLLDSRIQTEQLRQNALLARSQPQSKAMSEAIGG